METVKVILEKTDTGYSAYTDDVLGCVAVGDNLDEVKLNMTEAIEFHLEGLQEFNEEIPEVLQGEYTLDFKMDIPTFFEWASGIVTQTGLAKIAGINKNLVSQYANGIKKPGDKQLRKIETAIHQFARELQMISF
jgi:predicted RNase H-like HicB family nuclease